jgi:GNAT superfamily N-acetyltransferase
VRPAGRYQGGVDPSASLRVAPTSPDAQPAMELLEAYFRELSDRLAPTAVEVHERWPADFRGPGAAVVLGWHEGSPVGCAGLRPMGPGVVELKHFFLVPGVRGRGLGRLMLGGVEEVARGLGARRMVLDTATPLREAAALYLSSGYLRIPRYNDNPHGSAWFGRDL